MNHHELVEETRRRLCLPWADRYDEVDRALREMGADPHVGGLRHAQRGERVVVGHGDLIGPAGGLRLRETGVLYRFRR